MGMTSQADRGTTATSEAPPPRNLLRIRQGPLLFTSKEACPARLSVEDLNDPSGFRQRLEAWLLRQR